jgi:hypothetical protein
MTTSSSTSSGEACGRVAVKDHSATVRAIAKRGCATAVEKGAAADRARKERRSIGVMISQATGNASAARHLSSIVARASRRAASTFVSMSPSGFRKMKLNVDKVVDAARLEAHAT